MRIRGLHWCEIIFFPQWDCGPLWKADWDHPEECRRWLVYFGVLWGIFGQFSRLVSWSTGTKQAWSWANMPWASMISGKKIYSLFPSNFNYAQNGNWSVKVRIFAIWVDVNTLLSSCHAFATLKRNCTSMEKVGDVSNTSLSFLPVNTWWLRGSLMIAILNRHFFSILGLATWQADMMIMACD